MNETAIVIKNPLTLKAMMRQKKPENRPCLSITVAMGRMHTSTGTSGLTLI